LFELTLDLIRPIPLFALIPLFVLWFGIGTTPEVALIGLGVFLIMSLTTIEAIRNVPQIYVRAALTCGASRSDIYRSVVVPAIVPHMLTGLRFAVAAAWGLDVAAEYTGSQAGLGYIMIVRQQILDTSGILVIVMIYCGLAFLFDRLIRRLTLYIARWSERSTDRGLVRDMLGGG
jgi:ABC-type nitrate/sulfonate/bicarbonate transport system permease component